MSNVERSKIQDDKPQPIPKPNERIKKWSWTVLVRKDGKWQYEKVSHTEIFDMILRKWVKHPELDKTSYISLEEKGVKKVQTVKILIARSIPDPVTFEVLRAFFLYVYEARVPDSPEFTHVYLAKTPYERHGKTEIRGTIQINHLHLATNYQMSWNHYWLRQVGKPRKLTNEAANKLVKAGEIADVLEKPPKVGEYIRRCVYRERI